MHKTSLRLPDSLYTSIKTKADEQGISVSDFLRNASEYACGIQTEYDDGQTFTDGNQKPDKAVDALTEQLQVKDTQIADLSRQLDEANRRIEDARLSTDDASKRSDMLIAQLTQQLDRAQLQLEDMRTRSSWWSRLVGKRS